jgi:outer membrane receptor protein involved in Fe transport
MNLKFLLISLFFSTLTIAQTKGTVTGVINDKDLQGETLPFANVVVKGTQVAVVTDIDGKYTFSIEPGNYTIEFSFLGYESSSKNIQIKAGETITLNQSLGSGSYTLQDVIIQNNSSREKETALLLEQKKAVEIKQSIGAQEMTRKGVSDVEQGLTKITGVTKVDGRGLFIRGLEDRYNNLLLNDMALPSNSPFKKIIPLDLFPTDVVGYMDVYKTFNPDIYGDFAGGTVNINTSQSSQNQTKISFGTGVTTNNNLSNFLIASDASNTKNFFGFGGNNRDLPSAFGNIPSGQIHNEFDSGFNVTEYNAPLNSSFGVTHSGKFNLGKNSNSLKYLFSTNFDNKYQIREGVDRIFTQGNQGIYDNDLRRKQYKFQTQTSTLLGLQYKADRFTVSSNVMFLKSTENVIQDQIGYTRTNIQNPNEIIRLNQYEQSDYLNFQLYGNYKLSADEKHSVRAGISYTKTSFEQPDRKFINGTIVNDSEIQTTYGGNHLIRQFLNVDGSYYISGLTEYNFKFGKKAKKNQLAVGYNGYSEELQSTYRFVFGRPNSPSTPTIVNLNNIDPSIQDGLDSGSFSFREETNADYRTKIFQNVVAGYANILLHINDKFEINTGFRVENTIRELKYRPILNPINSPFNKQTFDKLNILPSLNAKYELNEKSNLRFAAGKTITRPVLMEVLPIQYVNADGTTERGNQNLVNSENYNADLKLEIFPTNKELFAATLFTKYIDKPIERTIEAAATGSGQIITYFNNNNATLFGAELEMLLQLSRISENLEGLSFGFNTSLMYTNAKVNKNRQGYFDTFEERKLQGASNWLINSDLKYEFDITEKWKNTVSLVYGVYGERIYAVGISGLDHIYEKPFNKLDLVWGSTIAKKWDVKFGIDNVLNPKYRRQLGNNSKIEINEPSLDLMTFKRGTGFSLNVAYTF